jgi:ubiquinone/menaquinone biosynthesis C-methylase UbiE
VNRGSAHGRTRDLIWPVPAPCSAAAPARGLVTADLTTNDIDDVRKSARCSIRSGVQLLRLRVLLDLPFEYGRYQRIRPQLFHGLAGHLLDAGIGTGRNISFYPSGTRVTGIDISPAMLQRAEVRASRSNMVIDLKVMDVARLDFPNDTFDAATGSFLFCVLPDSLQVTALRELARVVKPNGVIRLLEYVRPHGRIRGAVARFWQPWMAWVYGASFDRQTEQHIPEAGLELVESSFVVNDLVRLLTARVPSSSHRLGDHKKLSSESE